MKMVRAKTLALACGLVCLPLVSRAAPDGVIRDSVAVCDPSNPSLCLKPNATGGLVGGSVTDPNNAPYGASGAPVSAAMTITPGSGTAATPGRVMNFWCPPSTTAGLAYTTYTTANGDTDNINLQPGNFGFIPANVTYVAAITTVSGTVSGCTFKNHN